MAAALSSIELDISKEDELDRKLLDLNIESKHFEFIRTKGKNFIGDPELLSLKLGISIEQASGALEALGLSGRKCLSNQEISSIETFLNYQTRIQSAKRIAAFCDIDEELVAEYLEFRPLSDGQKDTISELFNNGSSINDIAYQLNLSSNRKIHEFVDNKFITFCGAEGQIVLEIIQKQKNIGIQTSSRLREMIKSRNLKLQDTLCCILLTNNKQEYNLVREYFEKFDESRNFFEFDTNLSIKDILVIRASGVNIEQLSINLNKVESVIREHLRQYCPHQEEIDYYAYCQKVKIEELVVNFGKDMKTFHTYRTIVTKSFDDLIERTRQVTVDPRETFNQLLPLVFYYLKCSLSLNNITSIIAKACNIALTSYDIFHMTFQLSDPVVRGLCIEDYSFSNPVPLYYPRIKTELLKGGKIELSLCTELWYCLQEYHGLVSFGLGQASWNPIGKSHLLDLMFEADFVEGNPQNSAFHLQSIDIQLTRNLFGKLNTKSTETEETTKWAYIDCQRYSDSKVIGIICQHLDIALIHVSYSDYNENYSKITEEIHHLEACLLHLYVFIRDCDGTEAMIQRKDAKTFIFLPNLTNKNIIVHQTLKTIGYEILHLKNKNPKLIGTGFIESVMTKLKSPNLEKILTDKRIIQTIIDYINKHPMSTCEINFSFLSYYPSYVNYMSLYYQACIETDYKATKQLNMRCVKLKEFLEKSKMGDIALSFNDILERDYSGLLLWKLSQELSALTDQVMRNKNNKDRYSIEIIWREVLLSSKYENNSKWRKAQDSYTQRFARNFSSHVERGEAFELIDGDNLRFFNNDINALLRQLYKRQYDELKIINKGKRVCMRQAPIVVSIFGRQSSGKSTLLNYCFGCKFLTSAGRCTRGIYGSLARLSQSINLTNQFLILDTEGLDAGSKRGISDINFDRTMVLFCLAVSQVVIINIKGELGEEMQNMLQICGHSLLQLKVSKVVAPKIFFVLNQMADPDTGKHLDAMNTLLDKLSEESDLMELEGTKISDLIQVSRENLFILPSAFNCVPMNMPASKLFDSDVNKLSPTVAFANKCAELRQSIINQLIEMPPDERATFNSMKEWLEMSGVIWETIIRYQDIVKYRNMDELKSYNFLRMVVSDLMQKHIFIHNKEFYSIIEQLIREVKGITKLEPQTIILEDKMLKFDETYSIHHSGCLIEFNNLCRNDQLLKRMNHVCEEMRSNLARLIYIERKNYKDRLKYQIKAVLTEIKLSENMGRFQDKISTNIDNYLDKSKEEQTEAFEEIWKECFGDNEGEEENERDDDLDDLYTIFKMESKTMENKGTIIDLLRKSNFDMHEAIQLIRREIQQNFEGNSIYCITEDFIYPCMQNNIPIKEMTPFTGEDRYKYLGQDTLYTVDTSSLNPLYASVVIPQINRWVPECCHSLVNYCSGYYNHADITWKLEERNQIMHLASNLKDPNNTGESTWKKLVDNISSKVQEIIKLYPEISQGTVKQLVNFLCSTLKHVNYEISYIQARLTIAAERALSTLVFAYAFESKWGLKAHINTQSRLTNEEEKLRKKEYFLSAVLKSQMARGNWDRKELRLNDRKTSNFFALEFLEAVKRAVITDEQTMVEQKFRDKRGTLSYKSILLQIEEQITKELETEPGKEIIDQNNIIVQSICNRNEIVQREFNRKWEELLENLSGEIVKNMKALFIKQLNRIQVTLTTMLQSLDKKNREVGETGFDTDSIFKLDGKLVGSEEKEKESTLKIAVIYLEMYLDPNVTLKQLQTFLNSSFKVEGIKFIKEKKASLCEKPISQSLNLDNETFKKLTNTKMFNSVQIFNIHEYIGGFKSTIDNYQFELSRAKLEEITKSLRDEYSSLVINCPSQCPSCGKFCEKEIHPHEGKCQIKTGHQICSMGGKVWKNDTDRTAILFMCDDYTNGTLVQIPGQKMIWSKFKAKTGNEWDWTLPNDREYKVLQRNNREKMEKIWDKFGKGILNYHASKGVDIKYIPYSAINDSTKYRICFVIDGTGSMRTDIDRARVSVRQLISIYEKRGNPAVFKIVIYRDHCDGGKIIEQFPRESIFTPKHDTISDFLNNIRAHGGGDGPEAVLDGLATATTKCDWTTSEGFTNIIIHIYDAPPHGNFPNYKSHSSDSDIGNCCCCNHGTLCHFDWDTDVWKKMHKLNIEYNGISTGEKFTNFEAAMKSNLGGLCGDFQLVGKETVNDAILSIFIDYKTD